MKPLIFDATPLIYLGKINFIQKITHFPEEKYTPESVYEEVVVDGKKSGQPEVFIIENMINTGIIKIRAPADIQYLSHLKENPKIHKGDAEVLALAYELEGIALLDDEKARGMAEIEGIEHHGTIYLLLKMMTIGLVTKEETLDGLNEMIHEGWRCSTELYADILKAIK
ncbi:MAG: putative nucleic acid-binding protein, contains PIN domain [Candidatus Methanocomedens sp.]|jgi:predicted nucleic acid-binding protein|nr:MAG: putative nucleic acid-binding protein, contains PIN domain [ANME-2 cluster archaeon]